MGAEPLAFLAFLPQVTPYPAALGAGLPPLLVAAERVAATVAQGLHGRRRIGTGENFWQFRPYVAGDARGRIDWRRSARSGREYVREAEWDAAQTVAFWRDGAPGMHWRSAPQLPTKAERAGVILLALASLLLRGGERVRLLDGADANAAGLSGGGSALRRLTDALERSAAGVPTALPPRHGTVVLFTDGLGPIEPLKALIGRCAALPARGQLVQVLDPAEVSLPYAGRVRFTGVGDGAGDGLLVERVDTVRAHYQDRLAARGEELAAVCASAGLGFHRHLTDAAPSLALLALYQALAAR